MWEESKPEEHGLNGAALDLLWQSLHARQTRTFLVVRHGQIIFERYADGWFAERRHYTASLAKALVGGLSLLLAMDGGYIHPDEPACKYIPQWQNDAVKSRITLRHLATHTSGIADAELTAAERAQALAAGQSSTEQHMTLPGWKGQFWRREPDPFTVSRDYAPLLFEPGSEYAYSNPGMAMLAYAVTASLVNSPWPDMRTLLTEKIMEPLGIEDEEWSIGYGETYTVDGLPLIANWGGGNFTPRAVAHIAQLLMQDGVWQGRQLLHPARVREVLVFAGMPRPDRSEDMNAPGSGLGWYVNDDSVWPTVPRDAFAGAGAGHQLLLAVPSLDLVIVRNGEMLDDDLPFWTGVERHLFRPVMETFLVQSPSPSSPVFSGIEWGPASSIVRLASGGKTRDGSDNWPMTWAGDGYLYTAYGDGYGFDPPLQEKLGLGFGVVMGHPQTGLTCLNIRSDGENRQHGRRGKKASTLLMLNGLLYLWVRNADGDGRSSQLAWSLDSGRSWTWADWHFPDFGYLAAIQFGPDYAEARDGYVYLVTPDTASAYEAADHFVLLRVPRTQLEMRNAYEFLVSIDDANTPVWSTDIGERGSLFTHPGKCGRSSISYHTPSGRYLWWQQLPSADPTSGDRADTRYAGGFAVYDAPEPWGPWTTVFFTEQWDVGPGESGCFPVKWMAADGRTLFLVFSGNDNFSVREGVLTYQQSAGQE